MDVSQMSLEEITASLRHSKDSQQRVLNVLAEKIKTELDGVVAVKVTYRGFTKRSGVCSLSFKLFPLRYSLWLGRRGIEGAAQCQRCGPGQCVEHDHTGLSLKDWLELVVEDLRCQLVGQIEVEAVEADLAARLLPS